MSSKPKICWFGYAKWFWPKIGAQFVGAHEGHNEVKHLPENNVINMI